MDFKKLYSKQTDGIKLVIIVVAIIIALYFLKKAKTFWETPAVNMRNIPSIGVSASGEQVKWSPDPLAREIFENIEGYNMSFYPDTAQKILDLQTDDQVILLYNHYNKTYASEHPTLTKLFDKEWDTVYGDYKKVVSRLKGLGLN
jgi:hypothetical protein